MPCYLQPASFSLFDSGRIKKHLKLINLNLYF